MLLHARGAGNLDVRGQPSRSTLPSVVGSILADSVASQSRYSLPTISGLRFTFASGGTVQSGEMEQSAVLQKIDGVHTDTAIMISSDEDHEPMAGLSRSLRSKSRRKRELFKL